MFDDFIQGLSAQDANEHVGAALTVGSPVTTRDGETLVFLTCKAIYRAAKAAVDMRPGTQDRSQSLVQAYFERGGVLWVFKACAKTNTWYGRTVRTERTGIATAPALGVEYVAQDVSRFIHQRSRVETHATVTGADAEEIVLVDPSGTEFGALDTSTTIPAPATETRTFLFGTPFVRTLRRQLPANRGAEKNGVERTRVPVTEKSVPALDRVVNG